MPSDLTIVIADVTRMAAIRAGLPLSGRVVQFTNFDLASAFVAIKKDAPTMVAIDALLVQTLQGLGLIKRVESLAEAGCAIRLIVRGSGNRPWTITEQNTQTQTDEAPIRSAAVAAVKGTNTRRAPRFPMLDSLNATVEGGQASLVNISVLGAQVVSLPVLRPGQTVKIALPDQDELLRLTAHVAWSAFQQTKQGTTAYRAGVAFTDAAQETLDDYCKRYGAEKALPSY